MKKYLILFLFLFSGLFYLSAEEKVIISSFSPEGIVKNVKQVKVSFSSQMVPFGNPRVKTDQFNINCPIEGKARWIDEKTYVYEFPNNLEAGIVCKFQLKSDTKTLAGKKITGKTEFTFSTGGPAVLYTNPYEGGAVDEEQVFILKLDTEIKESSLENRLSFEIEGIKGRVAATVVDPSDAKEILKAEYGDKYNTEKLLLVKSKLRFANQAKVSLIWGKGIESKSGVKSDSERIFHFSTRSPFSADFSCDRENKNAACIPISNFSINFTSPIQKSDAKKITLDGSGKSWSAKYYGETGEEESDDGTTYGVYFEGPFPEESKFKLNIPNSIKDETGRKLSNSGKFPLTVKTDKFPPLAKFSGSFGIIELEAEPLLPVTLRNLDKKIKAKILKMTGDGDKFYNNLLGKKVKISSENIFHWLKLVHRAQREKSVFAGEGKTNDFTIPKPNGDSAFEVVGIPLKEPGFYVVEIESEKLGNSLLEKKGKMYVPTSALVTNMSVHFKWGGENSLVWVTSLDKGQPVSGASITIRDCKNHIFAEGETDTSGILKLGAIHSNKVPNCSYSTYDNGLLVIAEKDKDLSFVHSSWDNGIEPWRFNLTGNSYDGNTIAHTILDRTLLRAGETVHMKHILREHRIRGLTYLSSKDNPTKMKITHIGSDQEFPMSLKWNNGHSVVDWKIPKEAKLGTYSISLFKGDKAYYTGEFKVEEFRVPLMKAIIKGPTEKLAKPKSFNVDLIINYLSGGPAGGMAVKLKSWFRDSSIGNFEGFEEYTFANGRLKEGVKKLASSRNYYDEEFENLTGSSENDSKIRTQEFSLDALGSIKAEIKDIPQKENPQEVVTELEYRDPVGETQTVSSTFPIYPGRYLVGLKSESWAASKEGVKIFAAVVDQSGKPKSGIDVVIELLSRKTITHRKRLVGGFYSYDSIEEVKKHATFCKGTTNEKGLLICNKPSPITGQAIFQASITDSADNDVFANKEVYITGKDSWFNVSDHDRMDVLPDKNTYESGETAKIQIRMPFKTAIALVSVEREGIIDYFTKQVSSSNPTIEVPIKAEYAPNAFISVLAVRGRAGDVKPTALVDLGRPSFRLGIAGIKVGWKAHELKVSVKTDRPVFKVREKATVTVNVRTADGGKLPANSDIALVAVDEGLLELMPNNTWELLRAMMSERGLEVNTATAQMQVVGRRHFGIKALPPGGGGGNESSRELFDTLLLWKSSVKLNSSGSANVQIPLNDSLTRFKIIAIASGGEKYFGTGSTSIRTTQDLMLLPGLTQLSREGDQFNPSFTVRNSTEKPMTVEVGGSISGVKTPIQKQSISLNAGEAKEVSWSIFIPFGVEKLVYEFSAKSDSGATDKVKFTQKVVEAIPVRVQQGTLMQLENEYALTVEKPADALEGRGGVNVVYSKSLLEGLTSVENYMKKYPYTCLEQQTSKLIVLKDKKGWEKLMNTLPSYLDSDGLAKYFPTSYYGSPTLTSYILAISNEAGLEIPTDSKELMLAGLNSFVEGTLYRDSSLPTADLTIRKLNAIEALARHGKAKQEHLSTLAIHSNLLPTSAVLDWWNILYKIKDIPKRNEHITQVEQILRSRLNLQGTTMKFTSENNDFLWWLMVSPDQNAVKLLLNLVKLNKWKEDVPRIVRGTLSRQRKGTWDITTANAWGVLAIEKFSKEYEKESVAGESTGSLSGEVKSVDWKASPKGATLSFPWGNSSKELKLNHNGTGKPWATIQSLAAVPLKSAISNGYSIEKTITPLEKRGLFGIGAYYKRGDLLRITLKVKADADMTWVVINDPIPTGASILGGGGLRDSASATMGEKKTGYAYPAFEERSFESYRAYYEYLPEGEMTIEYTIRLNQDGKFSLPATRVEAMYSPDMYGEYPNSMIEVEK